MTEALGSSGRVFHRASFVACLLVAALTGCDEDGLAATNGSNGSVTGNSTGLTDPNATTGDTGTGLPGTSGGVPAADGVPCDVSKILTERCGTCHGATPTFNAPMALVSQADFAAAAPFSAGLTVAQAASQRIQSTDPKMLMPPVTQTPLTAEEKATLQGWFDQGAPYSNESCEVGGVTGGTTAGVTGGVTGGETGGVTGGVPADADLDCYEITAHAAGDADTKYEVGVAQDKYVNFNFMPPWGAKTVYARTIRSIIDNDQVLHHWLFFKNNFTAEDLSVEDSSGTHPDSELINGWAPGGKDTNYYESGDVGVAMPGDVSYTLELHYNSGDISAKDASGLEICVTEEAPERLAGNAWVGTDEIIDFLVGLNGNKASGVCDPVSTEPIHILGISPHMHLKGQYMKAVINRADGSTETLHDAPFSFDDQTSYPKDIWLYDGDTITTTCTYSEPANFGEGTEDEMCYLFTTHTPAGALSDNKPLGTALHGEGACLGR